MIPPIPETLPPLASHIDGVWLKGDWHMHSRHSKDSSNNPQAKIIGFAEKMGFDYLAITDHDVHVQGAVAQHTWADPEFRSDTVLLFYGAELTACRGHINILSAEPYDHQRVFDHRDDRDWNILKLKQELGIHMSANHPSTKNHYGYSFDLADSVEIWNTSVWPKNVPGVRIWDDMLKSGRMLGARGGSDSHHGVPDTPEQITPLSIEATGNYVGTPTTWVFAKSRSKQALLEALVAGRASVSSNPYNPRVELWADHDGDGVMDMMMGDNLKPTGRPVTFEVRLVGGGIAGACYKVRVIKNRDDFGSFITDADMRSGQFIDTPATGERNYYRVEIEGPQAPYPEVPNSMAQSQNMVALSNPLYFNYDPSF
ncbi:CehA/McbA family metallohydrolase [Devosia sp. J2-20]|uniref:CehA/McbA family metallohydrolase n=1 Tax=Devosia sp. J2-20 TaxID=3026161 RepID=UPI00249A3A49|nr:CehA/McbA family metallohydrolase [Devosia sp. J2-20]WDQ98388.1 CehA/McbA family metallohydrolase [Devosia sp. J2-20]